MELRLTNFKFYQDMSFTLPEKGMTLIHGKTGIGKSTIFFAILFALYGNVKRPYSHGSKSCAVELRSERLKLHILRTFTPNKLTVKYDGITYENDSAQGLIEKLVGVDDLEFKLSSYFDQRSQRSILSMSPIEQLQFIETISLYSKKSVEGNDIETIKIKVKEHLKNLENDQLKLNTQLNLLEAQSYENINLSSFILPKDIEQLNLELLKKEESDALKDIQYIGSEIKKQRDAFEKLKEQDIEQAKIEKEKFRLETTLKCNEEIRNKLGTPKSETEIEQLANQLSIVKRIIQHLQDTEIADKLQEKYDQLTLTYFSKINEDLDILRKKTISTEQISKYTLDIDNYEANKSSYEEEERAINLILEEKKKATEEIGKIRKDITTFYNKGLKVGLPALLKFIKIKSNEIATNIHKLNEKLDFIEREFYACPTCKTSLYFSNNNLCINDKEVDDNIENDISSESLKENLENLLTQQETLKLQLKLLQELRIKATKEPPKRKKSNIKPLSLKDVQSLILIIAEQKDIESSILKLEEILQNKILPQEIESLKEEISDKRKGIPKNLDKSRNLNESRIKAKSLDISIEEAWRIKGDYSKISREIQNIEKTLKTYTKKFLNEKDDSSVILTNSIRTLENKLENRTTSFSKIKEKINLAEKYDSFIRNKEIIEKFESKKNDLLQQLKIIGDRIQGAATLELATRDAEFLTLEKTIFSINEHAKIYLDQLFENSISIQLYVKRVTKSGKTASRPSINIQIEYNGEVYDSVDDLCGGERQRCDLAFLLGVNDMLGSNIILLDECVNNLDGETNTETLKFINKFCKDKQILVISHEAVHGIFDKVIHLQ